ncbi:MAG: DNA methyltransferase [Archangium sp.]|nr:DNA methyltransferase [Archangium sp.]
MNASLFAPSKQFGCGVFDPPWWEAGGGQVKRGADRHYPLMKTAAICALPVRELFLDDSHLWLWVTNNFLEDGLEVMRAWGFRYVSNVAWGKVNENGVVQQGLGQYIRGAHELLLFGVRGQPPYKLVDGKRQQTPSLILAPRTEHSVKPDVFYEAAARVSHGPFIEGFARRPRPGWDVWGNEVESTVALEASP